MLSNLIKYNSFVVKDEDGIVIDTNQKVFDKINSIKKNVEVVAQGTQGTPDEDGFISGLNARVVNELVSSDEEEEANAAKAEAENIISNAKATAEQIVSKAHSDADSFISAAKEEGYAAGLKKAEEEKQAAIDRLEKDYAKKSQSLENEYQKKIKQIEPMLVDTLLKVFSKVTHTIAEDKKDMIMCLIDSVMRNTDISKEFYIRVSPEDYTFAINNQSKLAGALSKDVHIEIVEDNTLNRNDCIIETDAGVFDCSLDIQLENLIKDIKLLSCMNE